MRVWTTDEERRLRDLMAAGKTYEEIAIALGRTICSVKHKAKSGPKKPTHLRTETSALRWQIIQRCQAGEDRETVARDLGVTRQKVKNVLYEHERNKRRKIGFSPRPAHELGRESRIDELSRLPYRVLSGVQVRRLIDESGESVEALADRWGVPAIAVRYRAGLIDRDAR